jgi:hypothetical protein
MDMRLWLDPHYVVGRARMARYERRFPELPWLTPQANQILADWLKPSDVGFEWGSGRSTVWLAMKVSHLISVEHDREWAERVMKGLRSRRLDGRVDYCFEPDADLVSNPQSKYVQRVAAVSDGSLDFCLVDGWSRADCAVACLPKLRLGGLLVLDNAQLYIPRERRTRTPGARREDDGFPNPVQTWMEFHRTVANWRCIWTTSGVGDTALYVRTA